MRTLLLLPLFLLLGLAACDGETVNHDPVDAGPVDAMGPADGEPEPCKSFVRYCEEGKIWEGRIRSDCTGQGVHCGSLSGELVNAQVVEDCPSGCAPAVPDACQVCVSADGGIPNCEGPVQVKCLEGP